MWVRTWRLILLAFAASIVVTAQKPVSDPGSGGAPAEALKDVFPLRAIEFAGLENFPEEQVIAATGLEIGQRVSALDFEEATKRLTSTGVFEAIEFRYGPLEDGYRATFTVIEVAELYPVRFEGFGVPEEEIRAALAAELPLFGEKVPPTGPMVARIGAELERFWKGRGNDSNVLGRLTLAGEDQFEMLFQPETAIETIAFVQFENTGVLLNLDLQRSFNQIAMGVPYSEGRLKELLHHNVRPLYEEKSRMEVQFCPCRAEPDPQSAGLLVFVEVDQGEEYTYGRIELPTSIPLDPRDFSRRLEIVEGQKANMKRVRDGMRDIEESLKRDGFMRAAARFEQRLNTDNKTVDVTIQVDPGERYTFNKLIITGLDVIGEPAIRKRWGIKVGEPFDAGYPPFFMEQVRGMFDNLMKTDWRITIEESRKTVDVELIFVGPQEKNEVR